MASVIEQLVDEIKKERDILDVLMEERKRLKQRDDDIVASLTWKAATPSTPRGARLLELLDKHVRHGEPVTEAQIYDHNPADDKPKPMHPLMKAFTHI